MKTIGIIFISILGLGLLFIIFVYPKLKLITGFAAKNAASNYFIAHQSIEQTNKEDNANGLLKLATTQLTNATTVVSSVFGLSPKKAIYMKGMGCVLLNSKQPIPTDFCIPQRNKIDIQKPYPFGHLPPISTKLPNVNYEQLQLITNQLFSSTDPYGLENTRGFLVLYKGQIIAEKYQKGFDKNSIFQGWSITKSLMTTCFGVLEKEGYDIHQPITGFKNWQLDDRKKITTHHLLQMEDGLEWEENYTKISDVTLMLFDDDDVTQRPLSKKIKHQPGTFFNYASGSSNILSALLRKQFKTQQDYINFPYKALFDKIGMHSLSIETDIHGNYINSSYSWATTRDWAKFGQFILQNGNWNGEQLLSKNWTNYIRTPNTSSKGEYGGHWWLNQGGFMKKTPKSIFYADGYQGQRIFVVPNKEMVIVRFGISNLERENFYEKFDQLIFDIIHTIK